MTRPISKNIDLGDGKSLNVYVGTESTPSPLSVIYYKNAKYEQGPDSELPAVLEAGLQTLLKEEVSATSEDAVFGSQGKLTIDVPSLPGHEAVRVVVSRDYSVKVEQLVLKISCPGQPGWYPCPGYYRVTALALALVARVSLTGVKEVPSL